MSSILKEQNSQEETIFNSFEQEKNIMAKPQKKTIPNNEQQEKPIMSEKDQQRMKMLQ